MARTHARETEVESSLKPPQMWSAMERVETFLRREVPGWMSTENVTWSISLRDEAGSASGESVAEIRADAEASRHEPTLVWIIARSFGTTNRLADVTWSRGREVFTVEVSGTDEVAVIGMSEKLTREVKYIVSTINEPVPPPTVTPPQAAPAAPAEERVVGPAQPIATPVPTPAAPTPVPEMAPEKAPWYHGPYAVQIIGGIIATIVAAGIIALVVRAF